MYKRNHLTSICILCHTAPSNSKKCEPHKINFFNFFHPARSDTKVSDRAGVLNLILIRINLIFITYYAPKINPLAIPNTYKSFNAY